MRLNIDTIKQYVIFFFTLMLVVTIHESGHLLAGRSMNLDVNELNIGFGIPYLETLSLNFNVGEIIIHVKPIMLGGYVAFPKEFKNIEFYKKFSILIAGSVFNIVSAILVLMGLGMINKEKFLSSLKKSALFPLSFITMDDLITAAYGNERIRKIEEKGYSQRLLIVFSIMSIFIAIINLLPIFPLDGGRIIFNSMINTEEIWTVIMISVLNYYIIKDRKKIVQKIKSLTAL